MEADKARSITGRAISLARRGASYFEMSGPSEFIAVAVLLVLMIVIRIANIERYAFDSDESQHLHVIWGWVHGLVQYRDLFDNHMPLFHILFAPIFGLIGDRATILYEMRFLLLPMYFVAAWCTYKIGTSLFSRRVGIWAVILAGLYTQYHFASVEFRPDNVWASLWLLCITVLITGPLTVRRALAAGLLLGLCFGTSMKSVLFLFSIALAAPTTLLLVGRQRLGYSWSYLMPCVAAFVVSASIVPAMMMVFFAIKGVWREFRYCVFDFNFLARGAAEYSLAGKSRLALTVIIALLIIGFVARRMTRVSEDPGLAFRRGFVLIVCASYFLAFKFFWLLTRHDNDPPFYPFAAVFCSAALLAFSDALIGFRWNPRRILRLMPLPAFIAFGEIFVLLGMQPIWKDRTRAEDHLLRTVLALLEPGDFVLDSKGETIFRQRCVWPVFETITQSAIQRGIIVDNTPQRCVETHTCAVATMLIKRLPRDTRRFVKRNYLPVTNNLRIAGKELKTSATNLNEADFEVVISAPYEIISPDGNVSGTLDGTCYNGARFLTAGPHTFRPASTSHNLTLLWAQAVDRHFAPFDHPISSF
jgi:Dolichyl-phosphate-mannose-protein mannosyltransferase